MSIKAGPDRFCSSECIDSRFICLLISSVDSMWRSGGAGLNKQEDRAPIQV